MGIIYEFWLSLHTLKIVLNFKLKQLLQVATSYTISSAHFGIELSIIIIHPIFSLARDWPENVARLNMPQLKLGTPSGIPQSSNPGRREKYLLYLFLEAQDGKLPEHVMSADKYPTIFSRQMETKRCISLFDIFFQRSEKRENVSILWKTFSHYTLMADNGWLTNQTAKKTNVPLKQALLRLTSEQMHLNRSSICWHSTPPRHGSLKHGSSW